MRQGHLDWTQRNLLRVHREGKASDEMIVSIEWMDKQLFGGESDVIPREGERLMCQVNNERGPEPFIVDNVTYHILPEGRPRRFYAIVTVSATTEPFDPQEINCPDCHTKLKDVGASWTEYENPRVIRCPDCSKCHAILFAAARKEPKARFIIVPIYPMQTITITVNLGDV